MPKRRQKRDRKSIFVKYLYISNDEFWFRLDQGINSASDVDKKLDIYYTRLVTLSDKYWSAIKFYLLIYAVGSLSAFDIISKFSFSGLEIDAPKLNFVIVPLIALSALDISKISTKKFAIESIFSGAYKRSDCYSKAKLLLSYPEAYSFDKYRLDHALMPKYILPTSGYIHHIAFAIMIITGSLIAILANIFLYSYFAYALWSNPSENQVYARVIASISTLAIITTAFIPQSSIFRRKYSHYGLSFLFNKFQRHNPERWRHFVSKLPES